MPDIQFTPTDGNGVIYVRRESDIPENPDPSIVYMLWDGVDYRNAVRYEVSGGDVGRDSPVVEYTTDTLPDPASLAAGTVVEVNGKPAESDGVKFNPSAVNNYNTIAVFGTSIENFTLSPDGTASLANGGVNIANSLMGLPWKTVYDFGVDGDKSTGFVTRMQQVLDYIS